MDALNTVEFLNFVVNAVIIISLLLLNRESLKRVRKVLDILTNGGYRDCPFFVDQRPVGRRRYDENRLQEQLESKEKGGEFL